MNELNRSNLQSMVWNMLKKYTMLLALIVAIVVFVIRSDGQIFTPMNVANIIVHNAHVIILAIGMLLCILTGGNIDLSVGSVVGVVGAIAGRLIVTDKMNIYGAAAICLLVGLAIGMWQGFWIAYVRIPPFIVTLAGMLIFRGLTLRILSGGLTISPFQPEFKQYFTGFLPDFIGRVHIGGITINGTSLVTAFVVAAVYIAAQLHGHFSRQRKGYATGSRRALIARIVIVGLVLMTLFIVMGIYVNENMPAGVPTVLVLVGILLLVYTFFTNNTVMGRHLYAIGGNQKAARLSGVKTNAMMFFAYTNMAFLAAVTALLAVARANSASSTAGEGYEMDAIASCFIGGASAYGGIGTVGGMLIGALLMGILNNGMTMTGVTSADQMWFKGLVLLAAVAFDVIAKKQTALPELSLPWKRKSKQGDIAL